MGARRSCEGFAAALVGRFALARLGARRRRRRRTRACSSTTRSRRSCTRRRRASSTTTEPVSIPKASISSTSPTAASSRSTATSTTAGRTRTRPARRRAAAQGRAVAARAARTTTRAKTGRSDKKDGEEGREKTTRRRRTRDEDRTAGEAPRRRRRDETKADKPPEPVEIDLDGFEARAVVLPPKAGNYAGLLAVKGKVLYRRLPRTGSGDEKNAVVFFDLEEREEKTVLEDADGFEPSADGKKLLVVQASEQLRDRRRQGRTRSSRSRCGPPRWRPPSIRRPNGGRCSPTPGGSSATSSTTRRCTASTGTRRAIATRSSSTWRSRAGTSTSSSASSSASSTPRTRIAAAATSRRRPRAASGLLGSDWELADGAYRIKHIVARRALGRRGALAARRSRASTSRQATTCSRSTAIRSTTSRDPWAAFQGSPTTAVVLTVNDKPSLEGARQVLVKCLGDDTELRFREWIEQRRARVDAATKGRVGYVYVQSTGRDAQNELVRQFMAQWRKDGPRHRRAVQQRRADPGSLHRAAEPAAARFVGRAPRRGLACGRRSRHRGRRPCSSTGGADRAATRFRSTSAKRGSVRSSARAPGAGSLASAARQTLVDGGSSRCRPSACTTSRGHWFAEGRGVEPDVPVDEDPSQLAKGVDTQLERAIEEVLKALKAQPAAPSRPQYERRVPTTSTESSRP